MAGTHDAGGRGGAGGGAAGVAESRVALALACHPVASAVPVAGHGGVGEAGILASGAPVAVDALRTVFGQEVGEVADAQTGTSVALVAPAVAVAELAVVRIFRAAITTVNRTIERSTITNTDVVDFETSAVARTVVGAAESGLTITALTGIAFLAPITSVSGTNWFVAIAATASVSSSIARTTNTGAGSQALLAVDLGVAARATGTGPIAVDGVVEAGAHTSAGDTLVAGAVATTNGAATTGALKVAVRAVVAGAASVTGALECLLLGPESKTLGGKAHAVVRIRVGAHALAAVWRALGHEGASVGGDGRGCRGHRRCREGHGLGQRDGGDRLGHGVGVCGLEGYGGGERGGEGESRGGSGFQ